MTEGPPWSAPQQPPTPPLPYWEQPAWQQAGWGRPPEDQAARPPSSPPPTAPAPPAWPQQTAPSHYGPPAQYGPPHPNPWPQQVQPPPAWAPPPYKSTNNHGLRTVLIIVAVLLVGGAGTAVVNAAKHTAAPAATSVPAQAVIPLLNSGQPAVPPASVAAPASPAAPAVPTSPAVASTGGATAASPITPTSGTQVFADGFTDASSGWDTGSEDGVTYGYTTSGYEATPTGEYQYFSYAPYEKSISQLGMTFAATESAGAPADAGFGASCVRDVGAATELRYEFVVDSTGRWYVMRLDGAPSESSYPPVLRTGSAPASPGVASMSVTAVCATLAGGTTNRLVLFLNGKKVADLLDTAEAGTSGWAGALVTAGGDGPATIHVRRFAESDLGAPTAAAMPEEPNSNT